MTLCQLERETQDAGDVDAGHEQLAYITRHKLLDDHLRAQQQAIVLASETGQAAEPAKLVTPMIERFMLTDRAFSKTRRARL